MTKGACQVYLKSSDARIFFDVPLDVRTCERTHFYRRCKEMFLICPHRIERNDGIHFFWTLFNIPCTRKAG